MSVERLKAALKAGTPDSVYIFTGAEDYLKQAWRDRLAEHARAGGGGDFSVMELDGGAFAFSVFEDMTQSGGFFSSRKLVVLRNLPLTGGGGEKGGRRFELSGAADGRRFRETALALPEDVCLLLYYDALFLDGLTREAKKKYDTFFRSLTKGGAVLVEFTPPTPAQLTSWLARQFQARGKSVGADAAALLIDYAGGSMARLKQEAEKLSFYAAGGAVTEADVRAVCTKSLTATVFELTDAVLGRKTGSAMALLNALRLRREEPVAVLANLSASLCELYCVKLGQESGITDANEIASLFGVRANRVFLLRKYQRLARSVPVEELRRSLRAALEAETLLKGSRMDPWMVLETMAAKLSPAARA